VCTLISVRLHDVVIVIDDSRIKGKGAYYRRPFYFLN